MPEIVGHVDARNRALVNIPILDNDDALLVQIDTGFNGYLFVHESIAQQLGFVKTGFTGKVELADHTLHPAFFARTRIAWFGEPLNVHVVVATTGPARPALPDEPVALLGTALLNPHMLIIDCATRRVVIAQAD